MAKLLESPIGVLIGKLGQVVGCKWKGIAVLRIKSASVADPDKQLQQRKKFSLTMHFLQPMTQLLRIGWKYWAVGQTAFNAAMSYTIVNAIQGTYPNFTVDYPNALMSKGNLPPALNQAAASTVAGTVRFTWTNNSDERVRQPLILPCWWSTIRGKIRRSSSQDWLKESLVHRLLQYLTASVATLYIVTWVYSLSMDMNCPTASMQVRLPPFTDLIHTVTRMAIVNMKPLTI